MTANRLFSVYALGGLPWEGAADCEILCAGCGAEFSATVSNAAYNALACPQCDNRIQQFVNATQHTIRHNTAVAGAHLYSIGTSLPERGRMRLYNRLDLINCRDEAVIQVCRIGEPHERPFFEHRTSLITPARNFASWQMDCLIPIDFFPRRECRIALELSVANIWGDPLARHLSTLNTLDLFRRVVQTDLKLLSDEQPVLAREFHHLDTQGAYRDQRYALLLCHLTDYLLTR